MEEKKEVNLEDLEKEVAQRLNDFLEKNHESLFDPERNLIPDKDYVVKGEFLNNIRSFISFVDANKTKVSAIAYDLGLVATSMSLASDQMSLSVLEEYSKQQTKDILN